MIFLLYVCLQPQFWFFEIVTSHYLYKCNENANHNQKIFASDPPACF